MTINNPGSRVSRHRARPTPRPTTDAAAPGHRGRPRQRHRDLATDTAGTHEYRVPGPALDVENLQPLTDQRVERMSDDNETQIVTGRRGTMPPPSESRAALALPV